MSHVEAGALAGYNSLMDPHLSGYFTNTRMRRHLRKSGLITRKGCIVSESTYRLSMARKEHKKHVRDVLAQAIVHKSLDMERNRQVAIKQKLEEIAKIELVKRVRADRERKGDEDILPYLTPRGGSARRSRSRPSSVPAGGRHREARPMSAPARKSRSRGRSQSPESIVYMDEEGRPVSPYANSEDSRRSEDSRPTSSRPISGRPASSVSGKGRKKDSKYPKGELDDRHLYALDQATLREYTMAQHQIDHGRGQSPYMIPQIPADQMPAPPKGGPRSANASRRNRRRIQHTDGKGRRTKPKENTGTLMLHRQEPAVKFQEKVQTFCSISMHYFGSSLRLDYEKFDPRDDIIVEQQHCGGNTLNVFKEKILPGSDFTFTSRRHRGYPFSLSFYVNGVFDCRLSTCCEYKHASGARLGGRLGHFGVISIEGAAPCYKCQFSEAQAEKKKKDKKKKKKGGDDADEKKGEDDDKKNTGKKDPAVEVAVEDEDNNDDYENDFEDEEGSGSGSGTESEDGEKKSGEESETEVRGLEDGQELSDLEREEGKNKDAEPNDEDNGNEKETKDYADDFESDGDKKSGRSSRSSSSSSSRSSRSSRSSSSSSSSSRERTTSPSPRPKSGKKK